MRNSRTRLLVSVCPSTPKNSRPQPQRTASAARCLRRSNARSSSSSLGSKTHHACTRKATNQQQQQQGPRQQQQLRLRAPGAATTAKLPAG